MSKTILVTGGAGFIGSAVVRHLINDTGHTVVNLDKLTYAGNLENLLDIEGKSNYSFVKGDASCGCAILYRGCILTIPNTLVEKTSVD